MTPLLRGQLYSGAVELSRDRKSCHRSRHVDRRYFKVRERSALRVSCVWSTLILLTRGAHTEYKHTHLTVRHARPQGYPLKEIDLYYLL